MEKLVRDKIPDIITESGNIPQIHIANNEEFKQKLLEKLKEEVDEFVNKPSLEELADIQEIIDCVCKTFSLDPREVRKVQTTKRSKRGGFSKKIILENI